MDSIKKKMLSLSQATEEANSRASVYEAEMRKINEIADKFEEQVKKTFVNQAIKLLYLIRLTGIIIWALLKQTIPGQKYSKENAVP